MNDRQRFLDEHGKLTRRYFLRTGAACVATAGGWSLAARAEPPPELAKALDKLEPFFTTQEDFHDVSRGTPLPHSLPEEKKREVGLTRETWKLEVDLRPRPPGDARQAARRRPTAPRWTSTG